MQRSVWYPVTWSNNMVRHYSNMLDNHLTSVQPHVSSPLRVLVQSPHYVTHVIMFYQDPPFFFLWKTGRSLGSLVPRPFEGRRKGLVHTVCACSVTLRILGLCILLLYTCPFINPRSCPRTSVLLDFEPHSDSVIWQQVNQFWKLASSMCSSSDREGYQS